MSWYFFSETILVVSDFNVFAGTILGRIFQNNERYSFPQKSTMEFFLLLWMCEFYAKSMKSS
jgi:hypothetical protein